MSRAVHALADMTATPPLRVPGGRVRPDATERILKAAAARLAISGATVMTMQEVAEEAGVSKGLIHYHFHDKDTLLARLVMWMAEGLVRREHVALAASAPHGALLQFALQGAPVHAQVAGGRDVRPALEPEQRRDALEPGAVPGAFGGQRPRQLALDTRGEVVHARHDEVGVGEVRGATEEGERAERASGWLQNAVGPGVRQRVGRCAAAISRAAKAVAHRAVPHLRRVDEGDAVHVVPSDCGGVVGAALFLRYTFAQFLRFWLAHDESIGRAILVALGVAVLLYAVLGVVTFRNRKNARWRA